MKMRKVCTGILPALMSALALTSTASTAFSADAPEAGAGGLPQLNATTYPGQIFWLGVAFAALYLLMSRLALPRVGAVLEKRAAHKSGNLADAAQMQEKADRLKSDYERSLARAQRAAAEALSSAERAVADKMAEDQARFAENARKRLAAAEQNIAKAKAEALQSLADVSAEIAAEMAHKIADIQIGKAEAKKAAAAAQKG